MLSRTRTPRALSAVSRGPTFNYPGLFVRLVSFPLCGYRIRFLTARTRTIISYFPSREKIQKIIQMYAHARVYAYCFLSMPTIRFRGGSRWNFFPISRTDLQLRRMERTIMDFYFLRFFDVLLLGRIAFRHCDIVITSSVSRIIIIIIIIRKIVVVPVARKVVRLFSPLLFVTFYSPVQLLH